MDSCTGVNAPKTHSGQSRYAPLMTLIEGLLTQLCSLKQKGEETSKSRMDDTHSDIHVVHNNANDMFGVS